MCIVAGCGRFGFDTAAQRAPDAGSDAAADAPADATLDAPGGTACRGTAHLLTENFDDGVVDTTRWSPYADAGTSYDETGGSLEIKPAVGNPSKWAGYDSAQRYDLRDDRIFVEVLQVPSAASGAESLLGAYVSANDYVSLEFNLGNLIAARTIGNNWVQLAAAPYNPALHRYWQLRARGDELSWETSADGTTWSLLHAEAPGLDLSSVSLVVSAGSEAAVPTPELARFDNFNGGGAPPSCP